MVLQNKQLQSDIYNAFIKLWENDNPEKITVRLLCQKVPIARSTFYTYYTSLTELQRELEEDLLSDFKRRLLEIPCQEIELIGKDLANTLNNFVSDKRDYLRAFLLTHKNSHFLNLLEHVLQLYFKDLIDRKSLDQPDFKIKVLSSFVITLMTHLLEEPELALDVEIAEKRWFYLLATLK